MKEIVLSTDRKQKYFEVQNVDVMDYSIQEEKSISKRIIIWDCIVHGSMTNLTSTWIFFYLLHEKLTLTDS